MIKYSLYFLSRRPLTPAPMLESILKNQGLTSREVAAYTLLLELGEQPASTIAKKLHLSRSSSYALLAKLMERGLTSQISKNGVSFFAATDPALVLETAARKSREELNQISTLKLNLKFIRRQNAFEQAKSAAHYYHGEEGLATLIDTVLSEPTTVKRLYLSRNEFTAKTMSQALPKVEALKILTTTTGEKLPSDAIIKKLPTAFDIGIDLIISGDHLALLSFPENFGILIESRLIADAQAKIFDLVWRLARNNHS